MFTVWRIRLRSFESVRAHKPIATVPCVEADVFGSMYGVTLGQAICYAYWFPDDPWSTKALVCLCMNWSSSLSNVTDLGGHGVVGHVAIYLFGYYDCASQFSGHGPRHWEQPILLGIARFLSPKSLVELQV